MRHARQTLVCFGVTCAIVAALSACTQPSGRNQAGTPPAPGAPGAAGTPTAVERGRYLVTLGGCHDCHTPATFGPNGPEPDMTRMLSGHPQDMELPPPPQWQGPWILVATMTAFSGPWGVSYGANLTPDSLTGMGIWTEENFIQSMRTGRHFGVARPILPPMPWQNLKDATEEDLKAMYAYLRSIPPIRNQVPDPVFAPPPSGGAPSDPR